MKIDLHHDIKYDPELEDAGKIITTAVIFSEYGILTFKTSLLAEEFIDDGYDECYSKAELVNFFTEVGINDDDITDLLRRLIDYVGEVTCPASFKYSPGCVLKVWLDLDLSPDHDDDDDDSQSQIEEQAAQASFNDDNDDATHDDDLDDDDSQIEEEEEEAAQVSFDETSNIRFRPASKLVVKSLTRKIYKTKTKMDKMKNLYDSFFVSVTKKNTHKKISLEECTICMEEFSNGGRVVTLPCGHDFDEKCVVNWLETSHVCPMCRFEFPCEAQ